jgi:nitrogen fixation protein NifB
VDPAIGAQVYAWARDGKTLYRGKEAGALIWERQRVAIGELKKNGITVKINSILIPGINDDHIPEVARTVRALGADVLNCIPMVPVEGAEFEDLPAPSPSSLEGTRNEIEKIIPLMRHCTRCRADASGLLGEPMAEETVQDLREAASLPSRPEEVRPYVAVASREGVLVNQHLGEAEDIWVFAESDGQYILVEKRKTPAPGAGEDRWRELARALKDCRLLLTSGAGLSPLRTLTEEGLRVEMVEGLISSGLEAAFGKGNFSKLHVPWRGCGTVCQGGGGGCG